MQKREVGSEAWCSFLVVVLARGADPAYRQPLDSIVFGPYALFGQPERLRGAHLMKLRYEARASISFADNVLATCGIGSAAA